MFHGDLNRRFRAYDAATGKQLWETILGRPIAVNTMTYAVNGRQYVAVTTGDTLMSGLGAAAKETKESLGDLRVCAAAKLEKVSAATHL